MAASSSRRSREANSRHISRLTCCSKAPTTRPHPRHRLRPRQHSRPRPSPPPYRPYHSLSCALRSESAKTTMHMTPRMPRRSGCERHMPPANARCSLSRPKPRLHRPHFQCRHNYHSQPHQQRNASQMFLVPAKSVERKRTRRNGRRSLRLGDIL
jgi:hypothetical protein